MRKQRYKHSSMENKDSFTVEKLDFLWFTEESDLCLEVVDPSPLLHTLRVLATPGSYLSKALAKFVDDISILIVFW